MNAKRLRKPSSVGTSNPRHGQWGGSYRRIRAAVISALWALVCIFGHTAVGQYSGIRIPKGYVQVEGDIIMTESDAVTLRTQLQGPSPSFVYAPSRLWPNRVVPYYFDPGVTPSQQGTFQAAMADWANSFPGVTTVSFRPRNGEAGFVYFLVADPGFVGGSANYVGYGGGTLVITIHPNAVNTSVITHEIGHALGLWHEQSRLDRDLYITIIWTNIASGYGSQYEMKSPQSTFGDYDYESLMHYAPCDFSKCDGQAGRPSCGCRDPDCRTIEVVARYSAQQCRIGAQTLLSAMDRRAMAFMYGPPDWKFLYSKPGSAMDGSFQQPYTTLSHAVVSVPRYSTLWLGPGTYSAAGMTISTPMTLSAAIADLQMQPDGTLGPSSSGHAILR